VVTIKSAIHIHHETLIVYCELFQSYKLYKKSGEQYSYYLFGKNTVSFMEEIDLNKFIPVDVSEDRGNYRVYSRNLACIQFTPRYVTAVKKDSMINYIFSTLEWSSPLLHYFSPKGTESVLVAPNANIQFCSDGALRNSIGGYGVVMSINERIVGSTKLKLEPTYNKFTSYRCEALDMLCALALYNKVQQYTESHRGHREQASVTLFCDNEALVKVVNKWRMKPITPKYFYTQDADIIHEIMILLKYFGKHGENVWIRHVKGHQDRTSSQLTHAATLNIEAD
jgi:hypothetical protein